jgi:hypothetical protein
VKINGADHPAFRQDGIWRIAARGRPQGSAGDFGACRIDLDWCRDAVALRELTGVLGSLNATFP